MKLLINTGWSILSWLTSILVVIAWPLQFVGDLLCLPSKWIARKMHEQDMEELKRAYGPLLAQLPERPVKPEGEAN